MDNKQYARDQRPKNKVKTRKVHFCAQCGEPIEITSEATLRVYKLDGTFHYDYLHSVCARRLSKIETC